ncbi:UDP-Gal or UDP-GlcNAc-dependent glycosyltransferase, putative [Trypanosoma brucei brucei TREU927]|uniref:Hexosyltransferase n=1 Tax=Trypanosoma brucei brucei (strain 927/4 GUTat10.1) TaxID=185431 RepID=Q57YS1_TRYB2|nr:UDP-Gal or UDP-GlcNAc-dependent glycosyltransferase, putative [Trypanosoma brucei brucei TREU927]AAX69247.1 UDP-Gal or UDP-GlcNAc-dependent glycosyltransferase, putative [Trypanosoma brucei]AAZ13478.1 UDP-Gal or UDP-GlcNAc-dependent glycosyltransferase, putative [Trypanosoma brucei brucei TREU927]
MRTRRRRSQVYAFTLAVLIAISCLVVCCDLFFLSVIHLPLEEEKASAPINVDECLRLTAPSTVSIWQEREFLVIVGIPSVDRDEWQKRRNLQRRTCWQYAGVATLENNFTGELLPLYLLAPHQLNGYEISESLRDEASRTNDVVMLPTNDVCSFSRRKIGEGGSWGVESELVMSRKTFLWLQFAVTAFPNVSYIVKGDDDVFVRVPQYLADLRVMPRNGLYMGRVYGATFFWRSGGIPFAAGYFTTFSRDVAEAVASYRPLERLLKAPYSIWRMRQYLSMSVLHEDVMTALVLQDKIRYKGLIIVDAAPCHFHNAGKKGIRASLIDEYVVVHHIKENDYEVLMNHFADIAVQPKPSKVMWRSENYAVMQCFATLRLRRSALLALLSALGTTFRRHP